MVKCLKQLWAWFNGVKPLPKYDIPETTVFEKFMGIAINKYRNARGLMPLVFNQAAYEQAYLHSNYMAGENRMTHEDFNIRVSTLFHTAKATTVRENIAVGYKTFYQILEAWENSPEHKENLEATDVTLMGFSEVVDVNGTFWYTLILVG